ncbi:MAG: S-layer homology domain-containing protein [Clostridia bacterium]|nr:S-layer homology domain-containing protein [Clostridia bacterium]
MKKRKLIASFLIALTLISTISCFAASASFGSGVAVLANETKIIKSGIYGQKIVFSDLDFKQGLSITDFDKIEIKSIPLSTEGTLLLAGRKVKEGTVIKRKNIGALVFIPASKEVSECKFIFTTEAFGEGAPVEFVIRYTDKVNYAPEIDDSKTASLNTQRNISLYGKMSATDKDGDDIEYIIVSYPKVGTLKIIDSENGEYFYTPPAEYSGSDSFSYVARDEWGNFSSLAKVKIEVTERMSEVVYVDMQTHPQYNAAVALTAMGIMDGKIIGEGTYFIPDQTVTRAEFLTMALKAASIKGDQSTSKSYFDDNDEIPSPLLPYVKAAANLGIISGEFKGGKLLFRPNDAITKYEAAMIISALVGNVDTETVNFSSDSTVPVWARDDVAAVCAVGIFSYDDISANAKLSLTKAESAEYLYNMINYLEK